MSRQTIGFLNVSPVDDLKILQGRSTKTAPSDDDDDDDDDDDEDINNLILYDNPEDGVDGLDLIQEALGFGKEYEDRPTYPRDRSSTMMRTYSKASTATTRSAASKKTELSQLSLKEDKYPQAIKVIIRRRPAEKILASRMKIKEGVASDQRASATKQQVV